MNPYAVEPPEDLDDFWREAIMEADSVPLKFTRSLTNDFNFSGFTVETLEFQGVGGARLQGWIAYEPGARRNPAFLWLPPYGRESMLPDAYGTRPGFVSLSFNFHGLSAFHQEKYRMERGYFAEGAADAETWIFRSMFQNALVAVKVLEAQLEVDEDRIGAMGLSQGGGMAIWLGAWSARIKAVCADLPFLGGVSHTLISRVHRYPLKELSDFMRSIPVGEARVLNTVSYFDTVAQATRCRKPTQVALGLRDPGCRPDSVRAIYDALPGPKRLLEYDCGHDWYPDMVGNNQEWLSQTLG